MRKMRCFATLLLALGANCLDINAQNGAHANLLYNSDFNAVSAVGLSTTATSVDPVAGGGGYSAARDWYSWINGTGAVMSDLEPTTDPSGSGNMLHVSATIDRSGVVQIFGPVANAGPDEVNFSVRVYVVRGCVGMGVGNGADTFVSAKTCAQNKWVLMRGRNSVSPANEVIIYSEGGPAEWYADQASVVEKNVPPKACSAK